MLKTLEYYFRNGAHVKFDKYIIDTISGVASNTETGNIISTRKSKSGYNMWSVQDDDGKTHHIYVGRALASLRGPPPTLKHTADHIDRDKNNDILDNIRWLCKKEQRANQNRSKNMKTAFIIIKDGVQKTSKEWVEYFEDQKNSLGRKYNDDMIRDYAKKKRHGFSYKEYPDLPGEVWKDIIGSKNTAGCWKISNMCRVKYITKYAENVLFGDRIGLCSGYPAICINGKISLCHVISFMTFFPEEWAVKKSNEIILHDDDDPMNFCPNKLRLGTYSDNGKDAHDNGKYDGTKTTRMRCASYINGVFEKEHESKASAARYLRSIGLDKATAGGVNQAFDNDRKSAYGRTWKRLQELVSASY
jgi:hypothetical protein